MGKCLFGCEFALDEDLFSKHCDFARLFDDQERIRIRYPTYYIKNAFISTNILQLVSTEITNCGPPATCLVHCHKSDEVMGRIDISYSSSVAYLIAANSASVMSMYDTY